MYLSSKDATFFAVHLQAFMTIKFTIMHMFSQPVDLKILNKVQTCLLGSNRMVNVCIRNGSNVGSSGFTGRKDENGTLTC